MREDLTVEIPRKYKKALIERFSLKNARKGKKRLWIIRRKCPLCKDYHIGTFLCDKGCPFIKFGKFNGCMFWMAELVGPTATWSLYFGVDGICWDVDDDKQARKELKLLKKKARKLIKWV